MLQRQLHLRSLRLADLAPVTVGEEMEERCAAQFETLQVIQKSLQEFLDING